MRRGEMGDYDGLLFHIYRDDAKEYRWRLRARNGRIIADCGEGYKTRRAMLEAIKLIQLGAGKSEVRQK
jgi:uncharacterized protein YegP (UPF0339 family)